MQFSYKKLSAAGEIVEGVAEFASLTDAKSQLLAGGGLILDLKEEKKHRQLRLNLEQKLEFAYQMHQLVAAGLPLYESLLSLKEKKVAYLPIISVLADNVKEGKSLSQALHEMPKTFDPLFLAIIQASEATGEIKEGFYSLKMLLDRQLRIIKILKNALIYPVILLFFACTIVHGLIFFIIPSLSELFEGREVQGLTFMILNLSRFAVNHVMEIFISYLLMGLALFGAHKSGMLKNWFFFMMKQIPFCQKLILSVKFENFFSCLAQLLSRGINLKEALLLSKNVLKHQELETRVDDVLAQILKGKPLSSALDAPFPQIVKRLIGLSEQTGKLSEACLKLSQIFQEDVEKRLQRMTVFIQPILLALIGLIVGLVVLSILMPLTDVAGNVDGFN